MKIKFQGTQLDRLQFWSQYKTEIDKSTVSAVGKISYWKELLNPKVRAPADGLSFTTAEGCNRAKNILTKKFGNEYLVVNARIKTISLQTMNHYHQEKIHEFYEKQPSYVKINKWVCKKHSSHLTVIRVDSVRTDDNWQEWGFDIFIEALLKWTERNSIDLRKRTSSRSLKKEKMFHTNPDEKSTIVCSCKKKVRLWSDCDKVTAVDQRKKILSENRSSLNCTGSKNLSIDEM